MAEEGYLPPVVIEVTGDSRKFLDDLAADKAALADFATTQTNAMLGGDSKPLAEAIAGATTMKKQFAADTATTELAADDAKLLRTLVQAQLALKSFAGEVSRSKLTADAGPFWDAIAEIQAMLSRDPFEADLEIKDLKSVLAQISAMRGELALQTIPLMSQATRPGVVDYPAGPTSMPLSARPGGSMADIAAINAAIANYGGGSGGGGGGGGFMSAIMSALSGKAIADALGFGKGSLMGPLNAVGGMFSAGFGSLASLAGFGPEHLAMTGVGLAGSAAGGALGGGLLAAGSLGVAGVGMGTDLAGIGQAMGDIKNVHSAMNALNTAIATYGANSRQAAVAQSQLNQAESAFNPIARGAVVQAANTMNQVKALFDKSTGQAEKTGAQIITSLMKTSEAFIPTIGKFAAQNMSIIQKALGPLETWLRGPGLAIFTKMEQKFTHDLPTAMHAFTQAIEFVMRTLGYLTPMTGGLINTLDKFFTKMNGASWTKWTHDIDVLVALFRVWEKFVKILAEDIALLFKANAGLGKGIIQDLTGYLERLHHTLSSGAGQNSLGSLFTAHKGEIIALLNAIINIGVSFTKVYMVLAPALTQVATLFINAANAAVVLAQSIPGGTMALGIGLLAAKMGILSPLLTGAGKDATLLQKAFGGIGSIIGSVLTSLAALVFGEEAVTGATTGMRVAMVAASTTGILILALGIYELIKHFGVLKGLMATGVIAVMGLAAAFIFLDAVPIVALIAAIGLAIVGVVAGIIYLATHWHQVWTDIKTWTGEAVSFITAHWYLLMGIPIIGWILAIAANWSTIWHDISSAVGTAVGAIETAWNAAIGFLSSLPGKIIGLFAKAGDWLVQAGKDMIGGLIKGIESAVGGAVKAIAGVGKSILHGLSSAVGWLSPWTTTTQAGKDGVAGLTIGMQAAGPGAVAAARRVADQVVKEFGSGVGKLATSLNQIKSTLNSISSVFTTFSNLASQSGKITMLGMLAIYNALGTIKASAPGIIQGVNGIVGAFRVLDRSTVVGKQLGNLGGVLGSLGQIFGNLAKAAWNSSSITGASMTAIVNGLITVANFAPYIIGEVKKIEKEFDNLGNLNKLNSELSSLSTMFSNLSSVFTNVGNAATSAGQVTPQALSNIVNALQGLKYVMAGLPGAVNAIGAQTVSAFQHLVSNAVNYLNTTGVSAFANAGQNMMNGLLAGIQSEAGAVAAAAASVASGAHKQVTITTKTTSPSKLYAETGRDWMLGLVMGITGGKGLVDAAMLSAIPHATGGAGGGFGGAGGVAAAYSPTYHVTVTGAGNGVQVTQDFKKMLDQHDRELIARLKAGSISSGSR